MLRNKKYGMGGAVQSFSSPMLAQGMQGGLSGFGTSGLQTFAKGGKIDGLEILDKSDEYGEKYDVFVNGLKQGHISKTRDEKYFVSSNMVEGGKSFNSKVFDSLLKAKKYVYSKTKNIFPLTSKTMMKQLGYAKGGEIIDQYEGRTPADIWFNLTKSQRRHLLLDHANIPSGEISMYVGYDTNYDDLPHFVKQIVKKHFAEGQYAKGGQIASIGDSGIITDKNSMFVGKMALITGDLGNMYEVRVGERTTIVKKNGIRIISDEYADGGQIYKLAEKMTDADFEKGYDTLTAKEKESVKSLIRLGDDKKLALATILAEKNNPRKASDDFYRQAYHYADGGDVQDMNRYSSARTMGRVSQDWEAELKEYAGEHYKSLTPREREEIIADIQRCYDRNTRFAKGGKITHSNKSRNISDEEKRATYVLAFGQEYDDESRRQHPLPLDIAYQVALHSLERKKNEMAKGGQTSTYEVHLEAVPNIDYDQSDYRANVRVSKLKKSAKSIGEAVRIAKNFIEDNDLGSGNFIPAKLYKNGKQIGFISYNGRVWNNDQSEMKYAEGGEIGKDYVFVGNTMMNGEYKPVYKKDNKYYLKYYNPTKYNFLADEKDIKNYRIGRATDTYAKGGEISISDDEKRKSLKGNLKIKF